MNAFARDLCTALLALAVGAPACAQYTFTRIAEETGSFSHFFFPAINNSGTVVFYTQLHGGGYGIYTGSGGPLTTVADTSGPFRFFGHSPVINDSGTVAFEGWLKTGKRGIFTANGGVLTTAADDSGPFLFFDNPAINVSGRVAFEAALDAGGSGVFTVSGGTTTTIATSSNLYGFTGSAINTNGTVAFRGTVAGNHGIYTGSGGALTTVVDSSGPFASIGGAEHHDINDDGTVVFMAEWDTGGNGVFTVSNGTTTTIAVDSGPFRLFHTPAINNNGMVVFQGSLDDYGRGIFTGPDPLADKVIRNGDALDGSIVNGVEFTRFGLNDVGQVAFLAWLADGRVGLYRATPTHSAVPEPGAFVMLGSLLVVIGLAKRRRPR